MQIGGLQKNSFIDYPGKVSCVVFLSGCNFKCPYCHNPELAKGKTDNLLNYSSVIDFIETHKSFLDGVVISGGEPTLQPDLMDLCKTIKEFKLPIKLDTNGSRPNIVRGLIRNKLIDYIAMDIKTSISVKYSHLFKGTGGNISNIVDSISLILSTNIEYEFRSTCIRHFMNEKIMDAIGRSIKDAKKYFLQKPNLDNVLIPKFFNDDSEIFDDKEMENLKIIAEKYVGSCIIR